MIAEEHAQVNHTVSATEFFLQGFWGVAPGWYRYRAVGAKHIPPSRGEAKQLTISMRGTRAVRTAVAALAERRN